MLLSRQDSNLDSFRSKRLVLPLYHGTIKKPYSIRLNRVCKVYTILYRYQSVRLICCCCWYCAVVLIILFINILFLCRDGRIRTCEFSCSQSRRGNRTPQHLVILAVLTGFEPATIPQTTGYPTIGRQDLLRFVRDSNP